MNEHSLDSALSAAGGRWVDTGEDRIIADYGDPRAEYDTALNGVGIYDARRRGLIEVTGNDRASWLHNLVTNVVKTLQPGDGNYAFATNAKGRILFDCNILIRPDAIWLDIDRRLIAKVLAHLERYLITEDVHLANRSDEFCRIALLGPGVTEVATMLGAAHANNLPSLGSIAVLLADKPRLTVRHDFAGVRGLEFFVEQADAVACRQELLEIGQPIIKPVGHAAVEVLRIEAGIPVYGQDIDEEVLPAETQQIERGISFVKGCYLGQEIVERMRSRQVLARTLVGFRLARGTIGIRSGIGLSADGANVGRLTSACESYAVGGGIGLGYVKTSHAAPGTHLQVESVTPIEVEVAALPFR